ncbi:MAG: hypothetical protein WDW36_000234 [Sanguina aurantia]
MAARLEPHLRQDKLFVHKLQQYLSRAEYLSSLDEHSDAGSNAAMPSNTSSGSNSRPGVQAPSAETLSERVPPPSSHKEHSPLRTAACMCGRLAPPPSLCSSRMASGFSREIPRAASLIPPPLPPSQARHLQPTSRPPPPAHHPSSATPASSQRSWMSAAAATATSWQHSHPCKPPAAGLGVGAPTPCPVLSLPGLARRCAFLPTLLTGHDAASSRLAVLYLMDSIMKNVGEPYTALFAHTMPTVFGVAWDGADKTMRRSMLRMLDTWEPVHFKPELMSLLRLKTATSIQKPTAVVQQAAPPQQPVQPQSQPWLAPAPQGLQLTAQQQLQWQIQQNQLLQQLIIQQSNSQQQQQPPQPLSATTSLGPPVLVPPPAMPQALHPLVAAPASMDPRLQQQQRPYTPQQTFFSPAAQQSQDFDQSAVEDLTTGSRETLKRFRDRALLRERRQELLGVEKSRRWFVNVETWLTPSASNTEAFDQVADQQEGENAQDPVEHVVEEDPSQLECMISNEPFVRFYDPDTDKWYYEDAVQLWGEDAERHNVMDGSIIKVQFLLAVPSKQKKATATAASLASASTTTHSLTHAVRASAHPSTSLTAAAAAVPTAPDSAPATGPEFTFPSSTHSQHTSPERLPGAAPDRGHSQPASPTRTDSLPQPIPTSPGGVKREPAPLESGAVPHSGSKRPHPSSPHGSESAAASGQQASGVHMLEPGPEGSSSEQGASAERKSDAGAAPFQPSVVLPGLGEQVQKRVKALPAKAEARPAGNNQIRLFGFGTDFDTRFTVHKLIGSGSFGTVQLATDNVTGEQRAVKIVKKRFLGGYLEDHFVRRVQHEVDIYNHVGHSLNVAYHYGAYEDGNAVYLVMELCTGGELWDRLSNSTYTEQSAARVVREILMTVAQCHAKGIIIRDVKPENFLFANAVDDRLKMIDFGCSDYCEADGFLTDRTGTPLYVAPEVLRQRYSLKADVWSAGIVAYQLLAGRMPFENEDDELISPNLHLSQVRLSNKEIFAAILYGTLDFKRSPWDALSAGARGFVTCLLQRDPALRPTAEEALSHPWLNQPDPNGGGGSSSSPESLCTPDFSDGSADGTENGGGSSSSSCSDESGGAALGDSIVQRLQRYGTYGRLKQLALRAVVSFMATDHQQLLQLREAFSGLDLGSTGRVAYTEVVALLRSGRFDLSPTEATQLLATFSIDEGGAVDYYEWVAALMDWREVQESKEWEAWVTRVFDLFDRDHEGVLSRQELEAVLCGEEECPITDTVSAALREADSRGGAAPTSRGCAGVTRWRVQDAAGRAVSHATSEEFAKLLQTSAGDRLEWYDDRRAAAATVAVEQQATAETAATGDGDAPSEAV